MGKLKRVFPKELAYVLGLVILPLGVTFMEASDFGLSMVVAPAYLLHLKLSEIWPFFSFGMAEYTLQAVLLVLMGLVLRRFRWQYLLSFVTAVLYGFVLDGWMLLLAPFAPEGMGIRIPFFLLGMGLCSLGVALFFRTYLPPEAYELFVKELAGRAGMPPHRFKLWYDCASCALAVAMSFAFFGFGHFEGVKLGTLFCALVNGPLIGAIGRLLEKRWEFRDGLPLRNYLA